MCCVLIILSVGVTSVRAQDRLMYFIITIGAFSPITVRGLIYTYARGFITITCILYPLQYPHIIIITGTIHTIPVVSGKFSQNSSTCCMHFAPLYSRDYESEFRIFSGC